VSASLILPGRKRTRGKPIPKRYTSEPKLPHPRYARQGQCNRCGWCCEYHGCKLVRYEDGKAVCSTYEERPPRCVVFPEAPPILNPKCGYYFLDLWDNNRKVKFGSDL
jgi:hypothetical protein